MENNFKEGDVVKYDNGKHQEIFVVVSIGEYHLFSSQYNLPSFSKKYCKKIS
jgi:hypothetical protein